MGLLSKIPFKINYRILSGILFALTLFGINTAVNVFTKPEKDIYINSYDVRVEASKKVNTVYVDSKKDAKDILETVSSGKKIKTPEISEHESLLRIDYGIRGKDKDYEAFDLWYDGKNVFLGVRAVNHPHFVGIMEYRIIDEQYSKILMAHIEKYKKLEIR